MCYAIPGKVTGFENNKVIVDYFGEKKKAINEFHNLKIGDYIYAQGGYVIDKIPAKEARQTLSLWKEVFFDLQETDVKLSRMDTDGKNIGKNVVQILDKATQGISLKQSELNELINLKKPEELETLYHSANFLRQKHLGNSCCVHGIIEFSNYCEKACQYCGISGIAKNIERYRMTKNEIVDCAYEAVSRYGFKALVLQSGEDTFYSPDDLAEIISEIKKKMPVLIFISTGEIGIEGLQKLYNAGARGLLMRFETSNPELYSKLRPGQNLKSRLDHLKAAYRMGYLIITGGLIGLPGQTEQDLINDIILTKELHTEMYSFGPFIPSPNTLLSKEKLTDTDTILKVLALSRIIDPKNAKILVTTGFETFDKDARSKGLMAGANSVMLNVTPERFKKNYTIYPNRAHIDESLESQIDITLSLLKSLGRAPTDLGIG